MRDGFVKVAAGTPKIRVADCMYNAEQIIALMREAAGRGVKVLTLPELCLTAYTCGDLFLQRTLLDGAEAALERILEETEELEMVTAIGLPVRCRNKLFSCAAVILQGEILGLVPKCNIPNYSEFYEARWFTSGSGVCEEVTLCDQEITLDPEQLFICDELPELRIGVELCEDLWVPVPPSGQLAVAGATLILNLSASDETVCKDRFRRNMVTDQSGRLICAYVYADAGEGESTTDVVFAGHNMIAENGTLLSESRFRQGLIVNEIDVMRLAYERRRITTFPMESDEASCTEVTFSLEMEDTNLTRYFDPNPFVPADPGDRTARCREIFTMASLGLKKRLEHTNSKTAVLGLSGGLDSTLALMITANAFSMLGRSNKDIITLTMPCFGTTDRTRDNATKLGELLGTSFRRVDIGEAVMKHFADIDHDPEVHDTTYENCQARERTQVLMDIANDNGGLLVGTGDLSELALGWCTYNGDHMSMYAVNSSIPKTLVRYLTHYVSDLNRQTNPELSAVLDDVLATPVSPELLPTTADGKMTHFTEDLVGPYELHDFFLFYSIRCAFPPRKIMRLAEYVFSGEYDRDTLLKWLKNFYRRFFSQQFKRSCVPDGPKIGSLTLSPRGDWRMPSDAAAALWQAELEEL